MAEYRNLERLWLNNNRLRFITFLPYNYRLSELYLADNSLVSVAGSLTHLTGLKVLGMDNNQLSRLEETVAEVKNMQGLRYLSK